MQLLNNNSNHKQFHYTDAQKFTKFIFTLTVEDLVSIVGNFLTRDLITGSKFLSLRYVGFESAVANIYKNSKPFLSQKPSVPYKICS